MWTKTLKKHNIADISSNVAVWNKARIVSSSWRIHRIGNNVGLGDIEIAYVIIIWNQDDPKICQKKQPRKYEIQMCTFGHFVAAEILLLVFHDCKMWYVVLSAVKLWACTHARVCLLDIWPFWWLWVTRTAVCVWKTTPRAQNRALGNNLTMNMKWNVHNDFDRLFVWARF